MGLFVCNSIRNYQTMCTQNEIDFQKNVGCKEVGGGLQPEVSQNQGRKKRKDSRSRTWKKQNRVVGAEISSLSLIFFLLIVYGVGRVAGLSVSFVVWCPRWGKYRQC
ncbi:unnamed protein product [Citrullus colocynthis]|uniref:Transmembrane protein n=1 Tax=Citrullus colocynthis TaxID=252529 RepID=A0ABP0YL97_9ROSI